MGNTLRRLGYHAVETSDVAEAVAAAQAGPPDVIVTDEDFPGLEELLDSVRHPGSLHGAPVAIINPDAPDGAPDGDLHILADYQDIEGLFNRTSL